MQPTYLPGVNPYKDDWRGRSRKRIDARPQNSAATQAGMRGVHRDTKGNVIGGYTAEGQGIGTKSGGWRNPVPPGAGMAAPGAQAGPVTTTAPPVATANPNAAPVGQKRSWRDSGVPGTIGADIGTKPNANGGGLWRWNAMNPNAGKFGQQKPMAPGEIRDAPAVASKPLGPALPKPDKPLAQKKPGWRKPMV